MTKWPSAKHFTSWLWLGSRQQDLRGQAALLAHSTIFESSGVTVAFGGHYRRTYLPPRSARSTVASQRGWERLRRSPLRLASWPCCSTTPCAMACSTPTRAPRTMRNVIANASSPICVGVRSRWGLFSKRWRPREFLRKVAGLLGFRSKTGRIADGSPGTRLAGRHRAGVPGTGGVASDLVPSSKADSRAPAAPSNARPGTVCGRA